MLKRDTQPFSPALTERIFLATSRHSSVDFLLKDLKSSSRRFHLAICAFRDEYKLLERVYYKGNNQHRPSLFWRRVAEIRRLCQRFDTILIDQDVDTLRSSFFGTTKQLSGSKATRGSWTHFPDALSVALLSRRLFASLCLIMKLRERLSVAYRSFNLAMQSGAFLQLIVTLVAVVSRINLACEELYDSLQSISDIAKAVSDLLQDGNEDTILSVATPSTEICGDYKPATLDWKQTLEASNIQMMTSGQPECDAPARIVVKRKATELSSTLRERQKERQKKRHNKPRDEIDDIFGV